MTDKKKDQNPTIDELRKLSKLDHDDPRRKAFESKLRIERADNGNFLKNPFVVQAIREELQVLIDQYSSIKEHIKERVSNDKFKYPTNDKNSDPGVKLNNC